MTLELQAVVCRDDAGPKGASRGLLNGVSLALPVGAAAVLGAPEDGTLALVDAVTGRRGPSRGTVRVAGAEPYRSPACRARIGLLSITPTLPLESTARGSVALAASLRGGQTSVDAVFAAGSISTLADRPFGSLSLAELRAIEFALAITTPNPALLVLCEPFQGLAGISEREVESAISRIATTAVVLVVTASPRDAKRLPRAFGLRLGHITRETTGDHGWMALKDSVQMSVWLSRGARAFAARLAVSPEVAGAVLDVQQASDVDAGVVRVSGRSAEELSLAIAQAASEGGVAVAGVAEVPPQLLDVQAASDWEVRQRVMTLAMIRPPIAQGQHGQHVPFGSALPYGAPMAAPGFVRKPSSPPPAPPAPPAAGPPPAPPVGSSPPEPPAPEAPPAPPETPS